MTSVHRDTSSARRKKSMSNVGKIQGPSGTPEPEGKKSKKDVDPEAFHRELMKTRETDPDQQRKPKQRQEAVEEAKAAQAAASPTPTKPVEDTFRITTGKPGLGATLGAGPGTGVGAPPPSAPDTSEVGEEEEPPEYPYLEMEEPPSQVQPQAEPKTHHAERQRSKETTPPAKKEAAAPPAHKKAPKLKKMPSPTKPTAAPKAKAPAPHAKAKETTLPPSVKPKEKQPIEQEETEAPSLPAGAWEAHKPMAEPAKKAEKAIEPSTTPAGAPAPTPEAAAVGFAVPTAPSETTAPYLNLTSGVMDLFERMVGTMTVMTLTGETQTTLNLTAPQFANSLFYGAQITITEFSTAPKVFNISFLGNTAAAAKVFDNNVADLVAAFKAGQYNFEVGRIDVGLVPPKAPVKRKEKIEPVRKRKE